MQAQKAVEQVLEPVPQRSLGGMELQAYSPAQVVAQVATIQRLMADVMREDTHYGKVPGTDKPTLLKPGAEKLCFTFRLADEYEIMPQSVFTDIFIKYVVRCTLRHIGSGQVCGSGIGSCNSREAKYRYRWMATDLAPEKHEANAQKAKGLGKWRKGGGAGNTWVWHVRMDNDNPYDQDNTLLKMAEKRAKVAATLNATAASDIFTQDVEDLPEYAREEAAAPESPVPPPPAAPGQSAAAVPPVAAQGTLPKAVEQKARQTLTAPAFKSEWAIACETMDVNACWDYWLSVRQEIQAFCLSANEWAHVCKVVKDGMAAQGRPLEHVADGMPSWNERHGKA
jgi:hypothetical protein